MQLTADQELRRELLIFSLNKQPDLEAAITLAAQMEEFVLKGWRVQEAAEQGLAAAKGSEAEQPVDPPGRDHPRALPDLPRAEMNGAAVPAMRAHNGISHSQPVAEHAGSGSKKRRWSDGDDERLRKLWHSDHPLEEIAEAMGRTMPSLYSRARALGMSKRSPVVDKREPSRTNRGGRERASVGAPMAPTGEDDMAGEAARKCSPVSSRVRGPEIEVRRHVTPQRHNGDASGRADCAPGGDREPKQRGMAGGRSYHDRAMEAGVEPIIHFLRSRDYSVVRVENGRFKLDGRRILNAEELREKANQVAQSLGKPPFAPHYAGTVT